MAFITQSDGTLVRKIPKIISAIVDFGFPNGGEGDVAIVTVLSPEVQADSKIVCSAVADPTADHDPEDAGLEGIVVTAQNIVPGVGFDLVATAVNNTWGGYTVAAVL